MDHVVVICMVKPESKEVTSQLNVIFKRTLSNPISSKQTKPNSWESLNFPKSST